MKSSDESYCDDSDSDDEETNLVQKQFTKLRIAKSTKKQPKKVFSIKNSVKKSKNHGMKTTPKIKPK